MKSIFKKSLLLLSSLCLVLSYPALSQAEGSQDPVVYVVKKRDTLAKIGRKHGVDAAEIAKLNNLENPNKISEGQVLMIPHQGGIAAAPKAVSSAVVATRPRRGQTEARNINTGDVSTANFEDDDSAKQPNRTVKKVEYAQVRKEESEQFPIIEDQNDRYEEEAVSEKKKPKKEFLGGSIAAWFVNIDAEVQADFGPIKGTKIDLHDALGADDNITIPVVNIWLNPLPKSWLVFNFEYMEFDISGKKTIDDSLTFEGVTFSASDTVEGSADVQRVSGWVEINPFVGDWGYIGGLVGGEYVEFKAELDNSFDGTVTGTVPSLVPSVGGTAFSREIKIGDVRVSEDAQAGTVSLGGQARFNINENFFVSGRARAFSYEVSDIEFSFVDLQAEMNCLLFDFVKISGGYRALFLEVEDDKASGDLTMHGPFIQGGIVF